MATTLAAIAALGSAIGAIALAVVGAASPTGTGREVVPVIHVAVYGFAPVLVSLGLRERSGNAVLSLLSALLTAVLWAAAAGLSTIGFVAQSLPLSALVFVAASAASGVWLIVTSLEAQRAGLRRWSLIALAVVVALLLASSLLIRVLPYRAELIAAGWAMGMFAMHRTLGSPVMRRRALMFVVPLAMVGVALLVLFQLYMATFFRGCAPTYC